MRLQDLPRSCSHQSGVALAKNRELDQRGRVEPGNRPHTANRRLTTACGQPALNNRIRPTGQPALNKGAKAEQRKKAATNAAAAAGQPRHRGSRRGRPHRATAERPRDLSAERKRPKLREESLNDLAHGATFQITPKTLSVDEMTVHTKACTRMFTVTSFNITTN